MRAFFERIVYTIVQPGWQPSNRRQISGCQPASNVLIGCLLKGQEIERVAKFKYLGIIFDQCITWREHAESAGGEVMKRLGLLSQTRNTLTLRAAKCVYNAIIQPIFDYADNV